MASKGNVPGYQKQEIFLMPMCLISTGLDGKLEVEKEVLEQIQMINVPVVVVAIVGVYRTGKSYLMNRLAGVSEGFPLGNTIESTTKGIWVWCQPHPKWDNTVLLLLDTEGLGDVEKGDICHDNKIFTLAALLCNVLVYNIMSAFNQDAVEKITFITEVTRKIRFKNKMEGLKENDQLDLILPQFVLCVRDFSLQLQKDGVEITADQYLENCLRLKPGKSPEIEAFNRPRASIRKYFSARKCFTFDSPGNRKQIQNLDKIPLDQLQETFVEDTEKFLKYMYDCKPKKYLLSKPFTGEMFTTLVISYVNAVRDGGVPDVDDAMSVVANIENKRLKEKLIQKFMEKLEKISLPQLNTKGYETLYQSYQSQALSDFRKNAMLDARNFENMIIDEMDKLWREKKEANLQLVKAFCSKEINRIYKDKVGQDITQYHKAGGYAQYIEKLKVFKTTYNVEMKNTDEFTAQGALQAFLEKEMDKGNDILRKDQQLSHEQRENEILRIKRENENNLKVQLASFDKRLEEAKKLHEKHLQDIANERKQKEKADSDRNKAMLEKWDLERKKYKQEIEEERERREKQHEKEIELLKQRQAELEEALETEDYWYDQDYVDDSCTYYYYDDDGDGDDDDGCSIL